MFKYSLLQSIQAGPFSNTNRMIDLEIPDNMQVNPSQSFVQLVCHLNVSNPAGTQPSDVFNMVVSNSTADLTPMNVDLIRNCWLSGEKVGKLEDIRRVNVLQHNLLELSKATSEKKSQVNSLYQFNDYVNHELLSPFVEMHKEGSIASRYIDAHLRIPLSQLFELGQLQMIDTSKTGKLKLHLELEDLSYLNVSWVKVFSRFADEGKLDNVNAATTIFTTSGSFPSLDMSPFYVGQPLLIDYVPYNNDTPGTIVANTHTTVSAIAYNGATQKLTLTLSVGVPTFAVGVNNYRSIVLKEPTTGPTASLIIETAELGLCEITGAAASQDMLEYLTWTTEEYSTGGTTKMSKIFEIEPTAVNALMMFNSNTSNLISNNVNVKSYRMRVDNIDVYDRDILVNKSNTKESYIHDVLHYDSINRTFMNMGKPLKNMNFVNMAQNQTALVDRFKQADLQIMILACPTPLTQNTKKLQVNVDSTQNINHVILYKQVAKSVKL